MQTERQRLGVRLEELRKQLLEALDSARGDHQDFRVQSLAMEFDETLNRYLMLEPHQATLQHDGYPPVGR